jgi:hypothetical protein
MESLTPKPGIREQYRPIPEVEQPVLLWCTLAPAECDRVPSSALLDGKDLRRQPIEERKRLLAKLLRGSHLSIIPNETFEEDSAREACRLGCEGIVSKRLGSPYRSGRSPNWLKIKNPTAPAVKREAEEDWSR